MKKLFLLGTLLGLSTATFANLDNTRWQTIDDKTGKPKAIIIFSKQPNGTYTGKIQSMYDAAQGKSCTTCTGPYKNKQLINVPVVQNLKEVSAGVYEGGTIIDPKTGSSYRLKGTLQGNKLSLRAYVGISLAGRNQTWNRVK